jgi:hypothetical protein
MHKHLESLVVVFAVAGSSLLMSQKFFLGEKHVLKVQRAPEEYFSRVLLDPEILASAS